MSIIICPECGREVSDAALTCPHCGKLFGRKAFSMGFTIWKMLACFVFGGLLCVLGLINLFLGITLDNEGIIFICLLGIGGGILLLRNGIRLVRKIKENPFLN